MKADEILERYASGERHFHRADLRGQSFKGKNLSGANFTKAKIQSTNFTNAILINANFSDAEAGIQCSRAIVLVMISLLLSALSGFIVSWAGIFVGHKLIDGDCMYVLARRVTIITVFPVFFFVTLRQGLGAGLRSVAMAGVLAAALAAALAVALTITGPGVLTEVLSGRGALGGALGGAGAWAGTLAGTLAVAWALAVAEILAGEVTGILAGILAGAVAVAGVWAGVGTVVVAVAVAWAVATTLLGVYVARRALAGDEQFALIRRLAVTFAATRGTSFRGANLTDADFTSATLKNTDFIGATLTRTCWHQAKKLDRVLVGETYLQDTKIRQLMVTGQSQGKNFDGLDLRELNLSGANLANASFIGTDFYQSSLKKANLTGSLLVRTQFESTDLTGATLTGACIEDWVVTRTTKLYDVKCKYVFMKISENGDKPDRVPRKGEFKNDDFILFVQSILDTIKLYHEHDVNPKLALCVLQSLSEDYQSTLELVKIEKRGVGAIIEVKIPGSLNQEKLKETYYEKYERYLKFYITDPKNELKSPTNFENVTVHKGVFIAGNISNSTVTHTIDTEGDTIMPEGFKQQFNNDLRNAQIAGGLVNADTVSAAQIGGNINNYTPQQRQNLAEAAREIQQLLQQLEQTNPTRTTSEKMTVVAKVVDEIEKNPTLKARVIEALKSGGKEALKEAIDHPLVNILLAALDGWQEAE